MFEDGYNQFDDLPPFSIGAYSSSNNVIDDTNKLTPVTPKSSIILLASLYLEIIVLTSDSSYDNKGVSSEGPSITSIPKEGPSIARRSKEPIPKELLDWYGYDMLRMIYCAKRHILEKFRMRIPERCADKSKGKRK
ncbi:hypothetical protein Tco_0825785, partial [Tanacetum coccineum]